MNTTLLHIIFWLLAFMQGIIQLLEISSSYYKVGMPLIIIILLAIELMENNKLNHPASKARFLRRKRGLEMALASKKRIGEILCENGSLSQSQLNGALEEQKNCKNQPLGQILLDLGYITAEQLRNALLIQTKCQVPVSD